MFDNNKTISFMIDALEYRFYTYENWQVCPPMIKIKTYMLYEEFISDTLARCSKINI